MAQPMILPVNSLWSILGSPRFDGRCARVPGQTREARKIRLEFRFNNEERRDRRGEEKRGSSAIGSGDVALSNAGNRPGGEIAKPIENFRTLGIQ